MEKDAIDIHKCNGIGMSPNQSSFIYIVFCHSRCGNQSFYEWFVQTIIVDFVKTLRNIFHYNESIEAFYQLDGEPIQIECFIKESIQKILKDNSIVVGKLPASTSMLTQPADVGACFKSSKQKLKSILKDKTDDNDPKLRLVKYIINEHQNSINNNNNNSYYNSIAIGLVSIIKSIESTFTPQMIIDSFKLAGISPFNFERILHNCKKSITIDEENQYKVDLDLYTSDLENFGEIRDTTFNTIINNSNNNKSFNKPRENAAMSRKRSIFLTNKTVINKEIGRKSKLIDLKQRSKSKRSKTMRTEQNNTSNTLPAHFGNEFTNEFDSEN